MQYSLSNNHHQVVKNTHGFQYEIKQTNSNVADNMTPGQEPTSSWVPPEKTGKCIKSNGKPDNETFLTEVETNNNDSGDSIVGSLANTPPMVNGNVEHEDTVVSLGVLSTIGFKEENPDDVIVKDNGTTSEDQSNNLPRDDRLSSDDTACCSSDTDNACSLALLHDLSTEEIEMPCTYNVQQYFQLFKKCSNYKKLPNEYVNHNIRRNRLLVSWTSHNCIHLEWNIVDEVSDHDWIGLYRLGKSVYLLLWCVCYR